MKWIGLYITYRFLELSKTKTPENLNISLSFNIRHLKKVLKFEDIYYYLHN